MTDHVLRPDGTGFYLASGELTVAPASEQAIAGGQPTNVSITAGLLGGADMEVIAAVASVAPTAPAQDQ